MVLVKVSPWKGVIHFGKCGKLSLRYIRPFKIIARVGPVAYKLELSEELQGIHHTFHVSNLKKCLTDEELIIPLDEIQQDDKLHFIKEPVEIVDREVKRLKQSQIPIVKARRNSLWRLYLYGTKCVVFTDHKSLQYILNQKELNMRQRRVRALVMKVHSDLPDRILNAQKDAMKKKNVKAEKLGRLIKQIFEFRLDGTYCFGKRIWLPRYGGLRDVIMHESHKSKQVSDMCEEWLLTARSRQKSYADRRTKPLEFEVGDMALLKVLPWKGVIRFGKHGKLSLRYIGPFKIIARVGPVAYKLELSEELLGIHHTFHVSNLKKCLTDDELIIPLDEIQLDDKLHFIEEPVEIIDRKVKRLKQSRIPIIKAR
ncbi:putative reverse transcriptase domain-containing protein [Tanacetum coccineum]